MLYGELLVSAVKLNPSGFPFNQVLLGSVEVECRYEGSVQAQALHPHARVGHFVSVKVDGLVYFR